MGLKKIFLIKPNLYQNIRKIIKKLWIHNNNHNVPEIKNMK